MPSKGARGGRKTLARLPPPPPSPSLPHTHRPFLPLLRHFRALPLPCLCLSLSVAICLVSLSFSRSLPCSLPPSISLSVPPFPPPLPACPAWARRGRARWAGPCPARWRSPAAATLRCDAGRARARSSLALRRGRGPLGPGQARNGGDGVCLSGSALGVQLYLLWRVYCRDGSATCRVHSLCKRE